jgi:hypothetical protein
MKIKNWISNLKKEVLHSIVCQHDWDEKDPYIQPCKRCNAVRKLVLVERCEYVIENIDDIKIK